MADNIDIDVILNAIPRGFNMATREVAMLENALLKRQRAEDRVVEVVDDRAKADQKGVTVLRESVRATAQASRGYLNLSTAIDSRIAREREENRVRGQAIVSSMRQQAEMQAAYERTGSIVDRSMARSEQALRRQETATIRNTNAVKARQRAADSRAWDQEFQATTRAAEATRRSNEATYEGVWMQRQYAATLLTVSAALTAVGAATVAAFAQQERAFTSVERILMGDLLYQFGDSQEEAAVKVEALRDQLYGLSEQIPVTFSELSDIAAFGAALDIGNENLDEFASTVARITAMVGGDAEQIGKSLARIAQYTGYTEVQDGFEKLGSAIVFAGNSSIATEQDVLKFAQAMAPLGRLADVSAGSIIGLAASTASFASINVEGAGSAMTRVFANIDRQVGSTGDNLDALAQISGHSAEAFAQAWRGGGQEDLFFDILQGLNGEIDNLNLNMDALGIRNVRDRRVIQALAINYDFLADSVDNANRTLEEGTFLADSYAYFEDDLLSQWEIFRNLLSNTAGVVGQALAPAFAQALRTVNDLVSGFRDFAEANPWFVQMLGTVGALVAAWTAWRGITALVTSQMMAFRAATAWIGGGSLAAGAAGLQRTIMGVGTASSIAAGQVAAFGTASATAGGARGVGALRRGLGSVVGFLGGPWGLAFAAGAAAVATYVSNTQAEIRAMRDQVISDLSDVEKAAQMEMGDIFSATGGSFVGPPGTGDWFGNNTRQAEAFGKALEDVDAFLDNWNPRSGSNMDALRRELNLSADETTFLASSLTEIKSLFSQSFDDGNAIATLQGFSEVTGLAGQDLRTFVSRLDSGFIPSLKKAAEQIGINTNRHDWFNLLLEESAAKAEEMGEGATIMDAALAESDASMESLREEAEALLEVLTGMTQTTTGGVIGAWDSLGSVLNKSESAMAAFRESGASVAELMEGGSGGLAQGAIDLRSHFSDLAQAGVDAAAGILESGGSVEEAQEAYALARAEIEGLLGDLGVAPETAKTWADAMYGSFSQVLEQIEQTGAATAELNGTTIRIEYDAETGKFMDATRGVELTADELSSLVIKPDVDADTDQFDTKINKSNLDADGLDRRIIRPEISADDAVFNSRTTTIGGKLAELDRRTVSAQVNARGNALGYLQAALDTVNRLSGYHEVTVGYKNVGQARPKKGFATGGYTGPGGKYEPAGIVHKGEYVVPKHMVNQSTGLPYADALGRLQKGSSGPGYASGGYVRGAESSFPSSIALTPGTVQQIAAAVQHLVVLDRKDVTRAVNQQNYDFNQIGAY